MFRDVLANVLEKPPTVDLPKECLDFLREHKIPEDIIADLAACAFADWYCIGYVFVVPMANIIDETTHSISACIENGFLAIAAGANGDPICVDRVSRRIAYICHDTIPPHYGQHFEDCIHWTPFVYDKFWEAVVTDERFPWDYYEARRRWPIDSQREQK